ncbi:hypothetical protein QQF64_020990 [Cirrhinus molitorella]|uniref:Secreted protein n=1 Tax=Cirrhinus molitorella TaxID=172907 RepID=A0ABR3LC79_9TELE
MLRSFHAVYGCFQTLLCLLDVVYCNQRPLIYISQAAVICTLLSDARGTVINKEEKSTVQPQEPPFLFREVIGQ